MINILLILVVYIMAMVYGSKMIERHYTLKLGSVVQP